MKKFALLILFLLLSTKFYSQDLNIVGTWAGTDSDGVYAEISFDTEGYITVISDSYKIGGKEVRDGDKIISIKYETEILEDKNKLLIKFIDHSAKLPMGTIGGVYKYLNKNKIFLRMNFELGKSYEDFINVYDNESLILERK